MSESGSSQQQIDHLWSKTFEKVEGESCEIKSVLKEKLKPHGQYPWGFCLKRKKSMGILQDIADNKPIQEQRLVPAELVETFAQIKQSIDDSLVVSAQNLADLEELQAHNRSKIANCDVNIARLEAELAARRAQKSPPKAPENIPPVLRPTAPLNFLMNERTQKNEMETGTWDISITIDVLEIDELVKPGDFANNVAYENHRANIIRSTPHDTFPGFRIMVKVGLMSSGKMIIRPSVSKEDVMNSKEFVLAFKEIIEVIKKNSGLPG